MKTVFLLQHVHVTPKANESVKVIGVYSSKSEVICAIERLSLQPGFSEYHKIINPEIDDEQSGFYIDEYKLDKDHWVEGYVTL